MSAGASGSHILYEFGEFRLDAGRRLLYEKGDASPLAIKPRVLDALLLFVRHPGELLDKDRLLEELWPGLVVEESGLTQVISALRRVLDESPGENRFIATVPGRGYTFVADVVIPSSGGKPADDPPSPQALPTPAPARSRRKWLVYGLPVVGSILGFAFFATRDLLQRESIREVTETSQESPAIDLPARSVAVLPFENLSTEPNDAYVALGIAESILHRTAAMQGLVLIARTSSFARRADTADARSIGQDLNARYLVEGSVQRSGDRLRVTSQLIDSTNGAHLWSLRFDEAIDDIFAVEDEIARNIATALEVSLDSDKHPFASFGTDAYLEYLQGRALMATNRADDAERAIEHFARAIAIAPEFAAAFVSLADAHWQSALLKETAGTGLGFLIRSDRQREHLAAAAGQAQPLLDRAFELDDALAEAYILRADLEALRGEEDEARADYVRGLALNPNYAKGHERYGSYLWSSERGDDLAVAQIEEAMRVDPLAARHHYLLGAMIQSGGGYPEEVEPHLLRALVLDPNYHPALQRLGIVRWQQGRFAEAIKLEEQALAIDPRAEWVRWPLAMFYLEVTDADAARSVLVEAPETVPPYDWLAICLYSGDALRAAQLLRADPNFRYFIDIDIRAAALRDAAQVSGRYADARQALLELPYYHGTGAEEDFAGLALAYVNLALGERGAAETAARDIAEHDHNGYRRASALMLLGQPDAALDALDKHYTSHEWGRIRWWYFYERDASFDTLRDNPRFQALAARARAHADSERASLDMMRRQGRVPARPGKATTGAGVC